MTSMSTIRHALRNHQKDTSLEGQPETLRIALLKQWRWHDEKKTRSPPDVDQGHTMAYHGYIMSTSHTDNHRQTHDKHIFIF